MKSLRICIIFFAAMNFGSGMKPVPDCDLIIMSENIIRGIAVDIPSRFQKRDGIGSGPCEIVHNPEKPTYPNKKFILAKRVTVPIIVDVQNDFSDNYPQSALPVPGSEAAISVINSIRKQGGSWFRWKSSFPAIIRTEDTHPDDHISFAESKYWNIKNMKPNDPKNYKPPLERSYNTFKIGCKLDTAICNAIVQNQAQVNQVAPESQFNSTSSSSSSSNAADVLSNTRVFNNGSTYAVEQSPEKCDITNGVQFVTNIDTNGYDVLPSETSDKSYMFPKNDSVTMWTWPKHCVVGSDGAKPNPKLHISDDDIVVRKGYYTFRESLTGQVDCDKHEEEEMMAVIEEEELGPHEEVKKKRIIEESKLCGQEAILLFKRINLKQHLDDMENADNGRKQSRAKRVAIQNLIVVGFAFEYCVAATALSLASIKTESGNRRYTVFIVTDGVGYLTAYEDPIRERIRNDRIKAEVKFVNHEDLEFV